MKNVYKYLQK